MARINAVCNGTALQAHQSRVLAVLVRDSTTTWQATVFSPEAEGFCAQTGTSGSPTWTSQCPHCGAKLVMAGSTMATRADAALAGNTSQHYVPVVVTV